MGLLIGFESLDSSNLACMGKVVNQSTDYRYALDALRERHILIYGTFMFGLPNDSPQLIRDTVRFAKNNKMCLVAFAHIIPFPGTPLYDKLESTGQLLFDRWWMSEDYRFGQLPFSPINMKASELEQYCHQARCDFYSFSSIIRRSKEFSANCHNVKSAGLFFVLNYLLRREIPQKRGLPLGIQKHIKV